MNLIHRRFDVAIGCCGFWEDARGDTVTFPRRLLEILKKSLSTLDRDKEGKPTLKTNRIETKNGFGCYSSL